MKYLFLFVFILIIISLMYSYIKTPFEKFQFIIRIDISGRRKVSYNNALDEWINLHQQLESEINKSIDKWKNDCEMIISRSLFKSRRKRQYEQISRNYPIETSDVICVVYFRKQTRYYQQNYVRTSYKVDNVECQHFYTISQILSRYRKLKDIQFSTTLEKYESKNQRKLMTPQLRKCIKERDNYTCQLCGKYMPDEVGLQIDHIIPIKKGGKSVYENLQVLCSKCNGSKSSK